MISPIFIISGTPSSGKSTVSNALMQRFEFGLHIPIDELREWVVSGVAHPVPNVTPETERQFTLARHAVAHLAQVYSQAGFAVAIDDVFDPENAEVLIKRTLLPNPVYKVLLRPELDKALERNAERPHKAFDTSILENVIERIYAKQDLEAYGVADWLILDSSLLTVDETVNGILSHFKLQYTPAPS